MGVREHDVDEPGLGVRDERLEVGREVEAGRLACLRRDVADVDLRGRRAATASRMPGISRLGRRLVNRLPAEDDQLGIGDRLERVVRRQDVVGAEPDALDGGA